MDYILLLIQQFLAGGTQVVAKWITTDVSPSLVLLLRSFFAALIFAIWILIYRKNFHRIEKKDILPFIILGLINIPGNQYIFLTSIKMTSPANVAFAYALTPVFVMLIARIFLKEKLNKFRTIGILIAISGTILIIFQNGIDISSQGFAGDILALTAALTWSVYTVFGRKYSLKYSPIYTTGLSMIIGFILYIPIYLIFGVGLAPIANLSTPNWLELAYLAVFSSVVAYGIWYYVLSKKTASQVAVFNNIQPIFTAIITYYFIGLDITVAYVIGGVLIISGVVLAQKA